MATKAKKDSTHETIKIGEIVRTTTTIVLIGDTPLIVHAWSQKAKLMMLQKHMKQITVRDAKDPYDDFIRSIYRMENGAYGFPVVGIKEAMATAAIDHQNIAKSEIYRNVMVTGQRGFQVAAFADLKTPQELAELFSPNAPQIREDMVKLAGMQRTPDIRYRAEFWPWAVRFKVGYLKDFIDGDSVLNLLQSAGFRVGLAEWRQEKGGSNGSFHVADSNEVQTVEKWIKSGQKEPTPIDSRLWLASLKKASDADTAASELVVPPRRRKVGNGSAEVGHA